jgi:predicted small lipoprotein YifL
MRAVFRMSAIVAALSIVTAGMLAGCGQRGALYLPTVPPLPAKPNEQTQPPSPDEVKPGAETASSSSEVPDTSGAALTLSPDDNFRMPSNPQPQSRPGSLPNAQPASGVPQAQ